MFATSHVSLGLHCNSPEKFECCYVVWSDFISGTPTASLQIDSVNIYLHSKDQIEQIEAALLVAKEKLAELWAQKAIDAPGATCKAEEVF